MESKKDGDKPSGSSPYNGSNFHIPAKKSKP